MGQTRIDDRYRVDTIRRKKTFERAKERVGAAGVQLGEASPLRTPQGPVPPSQTRISRVDDYGASRVPSPFSGLNGVMSPLKDCSFNALVDSLHG